jgi:dipeptidyl aminopeptidase/acylaminoacyl peptidase
MLFNRFCVPALASIVISSLACSVAQCQAQQTKRPFTVADEIGLTLFGTPNGATPEVRFSPDGNYFAVWTERGLLDVNRPEDTLRFYRSEDVKNFLKHSDELQPPSPLWEINRSTYREGPIINGWRWLADSSGVAFLEQAESGNQRLELADFLRETIRPLTSEAETVQDFDVRDEEHYVYTVTNSSEETKWQREQQGPAIIAAGLSSLELLFPDDPVAHEASSAPAYKSHALWAVVDGKRFEVKSETAPLAFITDLSLSPDGHSLLAIAPVTDVPSSWQTLYPPPYRPIRHHIEAGHQDPQSSSVHQYVKIDLQTGAMASLTDAPTASDAGWWLFGSPSWSTDGEEVLLPGSFLKAKDKTPSRPCVAVVDLASNATACVEMAKSRSENGDVERGYHVVYSATFAHGNKDRVTVKFRNHNTFFPEAIEYKRTNEGVWQVADHINGQTQTGLNGLDVSIKQGFNEPPRLVATDKQVSKLLWDPNPQLKSIELGEAVVYAWKDKNGREWKGGLYKPVHYELGQRYPVVIQTHGFVESEFRPSGVFPTAFAARALAAQGIMVLQLAQSDPCPLGTLGEGACEVSSLEGAAAKLVSDGLADPAKIGIIGFSRTCFDVMETLTTSRLRIKAASITDGVMANYFQYMLYSEGYAKEMNSVIGAAPFGDGLQLWLKRSPGFSLDRIQTPLLIVAEGRTGVLAMWEPYAGLHFLHKPVEFVMLNNDGEHILTNPVMRVVSQGGSVDWFRFWLKGEEDPDPAKTKQYIRWRGLRELQQENDKAKSAVVSN